MPHKLSLKRRLALAALAAPVLAGSGLAYAQAPAAPQATPVKVNELRDMNTIRLDGRVTDVFGNRFVLEDATGRTLVELGPRGENGALVKTATRSASTAPSGAARFAPMRSASAAASAWRWSAPAPIAAPAGMDRDGTAPSAVGRAARDRGSRSPWPRP